MRGSDEARALLLVAEMLGIENDPNAPADVKAAYYSMKIVELLADITAHATDEDANMLRMLKETLEEKLKKENEA